ncbi:uncharacterized protein LOC126821364 [Patella vulgata]|uniref:uncharacterized protein LOC126821364 n=1 Tax=Patella vulgata TaxID=6465 RepID=UPI0024A876F6|nr:uncharacterized protein LOC126821364 [Patella vulgata]
MSGIANDGAAVMVGSKSGIVTRLKALNPVILGTHCIAHRLALGSRTMWLSFDGAVQAVLKNYSSLVTVLMEDNTPKIVGLLKSITSVKFLYCTYFLSDVLAVLCRLSKCYQKNDIMFSNKSHY